MICLQAKSIKKRHSALNQRPEQCPNSALKINNVQLQPLQLLRLTYNTLLLERLGDKRPLARTWNRNLLRQEMQCRFKDQHGNFPHFSEQIDHPASFDVRGNILVDLLEQLLCLLGRAHVALNLGMGSRAISSFQSQLYLLDTGLELNKALLHSAAEVEQDKGELELLLHFLSLAAGQECERVDMVVDAPKLAQTIDHGFNGC